MEPSDLSPDERAEWNAAWAGLRGRRLVFLAAAPAVFIPAVIAWNAIIAFALTAAAVFAAAWALRSWRCPRCHERFAGAAGRWWPAYCAACQLPEFSRPAFVRERSFTVRPEEARRLSPRFRRLIAASEIAGGACVMLLIPTLILQGMELAWWYGTCLEGLGVFGIVAGLWLWRDDARGYGLSRLLQALQILKFQLFGLAFDVSVGFDFKLAVSETMINFGPGVRGALAVGVGQAQPPLVIVNVLAAVALILLWNAEPGLTVPELLERAGTEEAAPEVLPPATG